MRDMTAGGQQARELGGHRAARFSYRGLRIIKDHVLDRSSNQVPVLPSREQPRKPVDGSSKEGWHELLSSGISGGKRGRLSAHDGEERGH